MAKKKNDVREVIPVSTNTDGSDLYQCPHCNEWTEGEEGNTLTCDFCGKDYMAHTPVKFQNAAKVISIRMPHRNG